MSSRIQGARQRARGEITTAIKDEARRHLAEEGASRLSLRAVARGLGMVSSALYRYFPSRDDLLTALITDAYDAVGAAAEAALADAESVGDSHLVRWRAVCRAVRGWGLAHPHEYALIYGSPVPGYSAPSSTTQSAARVGLALFAVLRDAYACGALREPPRGAAAPDAVLKDAERLIGVIGVELPPAVAAEAVAAWSQLFGLVGFELFGHFTGVVDARDAFFDHAVERLADQVGLRR
ncbi:MULTISPECIES: TetR/AcrR family transcriptional regulator [Streptomyces]|uniref:TetR/AcrR family transcriptional regulator n=1 Tax=Streptomyces TaxID=1883 RepID=UPI001B36040B|nr:MULTISPECIES: TetR/AcrR family transcriptional regulator [unclassified Streptomyces]MBQ0866041.1 TetR/AcrR family transcriptional regulator [Streptomyces sp. RK75]MBQ1121951.1 TetR/AcrR family transcriptional regulator [Streptomyces sp. B15]